MALLLLLLLAMAPTPPGRAQAPPAAAAAETPAALPPWSGEAPTARLDWPAGPRLPLSSELAAALARRDHAAALPGLRALEGEPLAARQLQALTLLLGWTATHLRPTERPPEHELARWEARLAAPSDLPASYVALVRGELLLALGRPVEAIAVLEAIPPGDTLGPRARLARADALWEAGRTAEARRDWRAVAEGAGSAEARSLAWLALAAHGDEATARGAVARLWREAPGFHAQEVETLARDLGFVPTAADTVARANALMIRGDLRGAVALLEPLAPDHPPTDPTGCRLAWVLGRSLYRRNAITRAAAILGPAGRACRSHAPDEGARMLYLTGRSLERRKRWAEAAEVYAAIPRLYPNHSMADDGLLLAGIARQVAGDPDGARELWRRQVETLPAGDMAGEGFWRLAWSAYLAGRTDEAIAWADRLVATIPLTRDPGHHRAGRYWGARWRVLPDLDDPGRIQSDEAVREEGLRRLAQVATRHPWDVYGMLAAARLAELDPPRAALLARPQVAPPGPFRVRPAFAAHPLVARAAALVELGLPAEAEAELQRLDAAALAPGEAALVARLPALRGDPPASVDAFRAILRRHPPETLGAGRDAILHAAWPLPFADEVRRAAVGAGIDPLLLAALAREESSFDPRARSHAGARGLVQIMPATGRDLARKEGIPRAALDLHDPAQNLLLGAAYLADLARAFGDDPLVAMAAYNAGPGNVRRWLSEQGARPLDEFVERIPFRETRRYVKRVASSWQVYRLVHRQDGPPFPDLAPFNRAAVPP